MQLIKITNPTAATVSGVPANTSRYLGFSQGAIQTDTDGMITGWRQTNQGADTFTAVGALRVEVGLLADNGRFCVQLTSRQGRT